MEISASPKHPGLGRVKAKALNLRCEPNMNADKVTDPLVRGTELQLLQYQDGWWQVRSECLGYVREAYVRKQGNLAWVNCSQLNFRAGPSVFAPKICEPLPLNTPLTILEEKRGWLWVKAPVLGWVNAHFVEVKPSPSTPPSE